LPLRPPENHDLEFEQRFGKHDLPAADHEAASSPFHSRHLISGTPNWDLMSKVGVAVVSGKPQISTEEIASLIGDQVEKFGTWPEGLTVKIYPIGQTWNASIKASNPRDALFRDDVAAIVGDLRRKYDLRD
jgi:hypothetical protein